MSSNNRNSVTDFIHKLSGNKVNGKLYQKIHSNEKGDLSKTDAESSAEDKENQRKKIIDDSLSYVTEITGVKSKSVVVFYHK